MPIPNRLQTCSEDAVTKAAKKVLGIDLTYNTANNDEQCNLGTLFTKIPCQGDVLVTNPKLGVTDVNAYKKVEADAIESAKVRIRQERGKTHTLGEEIESSGNIDLMEIPEFAEEQKKLETYSQELFNSSSMRQSITTELASELAKLNTTQVYMLRTGGGGDASGHFQVVYYESPNWILDSGLTPEGKPSGGILYNTQTQKLGPMAERLLDPTATWGKADAHKKLAFYAMDHTRTMVAAQYIAEFRKMGTNHAKEFDQAYRGELQEALINTIIARPNYLSDFGNTAYWKPKTKLKQVSAKDYALTAAKQCIDQDLVGGLMQLKTIGYFDDAKQGHNLLHDVLKNNQVSVIKAILDQDLVNLSNNDDNKELYHAALYNDYAILPGENLALRILQNKLLDKYTSSQITALPFTIEDACGALNTDAVITMMQLPANKSITSDVLIQFVKSGAEACKSSPGTYQPIIDAIKQHKPHNDTASNPRNLMSQLQILLAKLNISASEAWSNACKLLASTQHYICAEADKDKTGLRAVEYEARQDDGKIMKFTVSEREQIVLDTLYAKKLQDEENNEDDKDNAHSSKFSM
jgi:hypothetical protein